MKSTEPRNLYSRVIAYTCQNCGTHMTVGLLSVVGPLKLHHCNLRMVELPMPRTAVPEFEAYYARSIPRPLLRRRGECGPERKGRPCLHSTCPKCQARKGKLKGMLHRPKPGG